MKAETNTIDDDDNNNDCYDNYDIDCPSYMMHGDVRNMWLKVVMLLCVYKFQLFA